LCVFGHMSSCFSCHDACKDIAQVWEQEFPSLKEVAMLLFYAR
jgi:hypothetical protein